MGDLIERLRERARNARREGNCTAECDARLYDESAAALEAAREDSERYRQLRDGFTWTLTSGSDGTRMSVYMPGVMLTAIGPDADEFDAAIDHARGKGGGEVEGGR